jgi:hypothetical protein
MMVDCFAAQLAPLSMTNSQYADGARLHDVTSVFAEASALYAASA